MPITINGKNYKLYMKGDTPIELPLPSKQHPNDPPEKWAFQDKAAKELEVFSKMEYWDAQSRTAEERANKREEAEKAAEQRELIKSIVKEVLREIKEEEDCV